MSPASIRQVTVVVRAAVTDKVLPVWDENGGMYMTEVLGRRRFVKSIDVPSDQTGTPLRIEINGHGYTAGSQATWSDTGQGSRLEIPLPERDNGPLEDCLKDVTRKEIPPIETGS
ncbi:MAG: hypothetical protein HY657_03145 [Acidobacteria bacterium]|nr:hypothetical protein [Acidobacteriota bacterium]